MAGTKRLKVLVIPAWYPSERNPVVGIFVKEYAKATSLYNDVVVLYGEGIDRSVRGIYRIEDNVEDGLRTLRLRYRKFFIPKTSYFIYLWGMFAAFRKLIHEGFRPDVIHAHVYLAGVAAVLLGERHGIPVVISEHFTGFPRRTVHGLQRLMAKFAFQRASLVCPVSEDLKRHIESYGIRARFRVVPPVVNASLFSPGGGTSVNRGEDDRKRMLLVALLDPKKGVPYLLEALVHLRKRRDDFVLDVVGDGPSRAEYEELANKLGLANIVRFYGLKTKQEVAEFMQRCDFFVLSSEWENLPSVLIEAMASGLPIVATGVGGIPEIINEEIGILVPPKEVEALAKAVDYMLDHYQDYSAKGIVQYALERFSYEAIGSHLNKVYRELRTNDKETFE